MTKRKPVELADYAAGQLAKVNTSPEKPFWRHPIRDAIGGVALLGIVSFTAPGIRDSAINSFNRFFERGDAVPEDTRTYTVQPGDTAWGIARDNMVGNVATNAHDIDRQAGADGDATLQIGEELQLPAEKLTQPKETQKPQ